MPISLVSYHFFKLLVIYCSFNGSLFFFYLGPNLVFAETPKPILYRFCDTAHPCIPQFRPIQPKLRHLSGRHSAKTAKIDVRLAYSEGLSTGDDGRLGTLDIISSKMQAELLLEGNNFRLLTQSLYECACGPAVG